MSYSYVGALNQNLVCCICRAPFVNPYTTRTCSHTFCRECIFAALQITPQCPIDRSHLTMENLSPADPLLRNLVDELLVECPNHSAGCTETPQRQLVGAHLRDKCLYSKIPCPEGNSDRSVMRKDAAEHCHDSTSGSPQRGTEESQEGSESQNCTGLSTTCSACLATISDGSFAAHSEICPDIVISCTHASHGCPWTGRRIAMQSTHLPTCPYESIKGFFAIHDNKTAALEQENVQLRHQISVMQGMVNIMQRELDAVKRVLGPWYGPDPTLTSTAMSSSYLTSGFEPHSETTVHTDISDADGGLSRTNADLSLAAYFPRPEENHTHIPSGDAAGNQPQHHRSPSSISTSPSTSSSFSNPRSRPQLNPLLSPSQPSQLPPPPSHLPHTPIASSSTVAPLNISTTLYGTLSSLHTSVVSLASALDSLGRHQDVALTTEAMRMGEEIRSLRAVVSGLRMQVHAIMVDRNSQVVQVRDTSSSQPGPVSASNLPQHPSSPYNHSHNGSGPFPGMGVAMGEAGPWPYFGLPLPRFSGSQTMNTLPGPVTKL
ncbi:hypothetical protein BXZ70DRAFT_31609 [Cristinia sonorae]|uniref:RING-type domain-containing protein n=1 Tax=Cristinia sonorae TaxID=1940300 RepID=A0A8K0V0M0_9AGAR|nr:hypothetical protein BXZ70DRAFT_31609 [Cristinia sonorae]